MMISIQSNHNLHPPGRFFLGHPLRMDRAGQEVTDQVGGRDSEPRRWQRPGTVGNRHGWHPRAMGPRFRAPDFGSEVQAGPCFFHLSASWLMGVLFSPESAYFMMGNRGLSLPPCWSATQPEGFRLLRSARMRHQVMIVIELTWSRKQYPLSLG